ncbi:MAG: DUF1570 domain-containing protein [Planctomycetes bacterium]|nr:DUF1570 domain-containing protein [Planctomycetota bacterium]
MWFGITRYRHFLIAPLVWLLAASTFAAETSPITKDWKFDQIRLRNGAIFKGLILEESASTIRFQHVRRVTGRPTITMTTIFRTSDLDKIDRLANPERDLLRGRLKELDPNGDGERRRMEGLELQPCDWEDTPKAGWRYDSDYFSLLSNAPEEVVRRAAVRLEQIYTAYVNLIPSRCDKGKPTTIVLYPTLDEYQKMLAKKGWQLQNTAFFNPGSNRIVCGSNLQKLGEDLKKTKQQHHEQRAELDKEEKFCRMYFGKNPAELARRLQKIADDRQKMANADRYNDGIFDNETKRLFATLYHEAFHAYVSNFVYTANGGTLPMARPPGELPRWLNEGLAQIFETSIVEAGELRVGHADANRLTKVKDALKKGELMPVAELLGAGAKPFLVQHNNDRLVSDRAYQTSWALAAYLTFDRRLLGSDSLDDFIRSVNRDNKPEEAFAILVGRKLPEFEKDFHAWLLKLQINGSMLEPTMGKVP